MNKDYLHQMFEYKDGELFWKISPNSRIREGKKAGWDCGRYLYVQLNKKNYPIHRFVFMMHKGFFPETVDHIDGDTKNNKIENLREATHAKSITKAIRKSNNTSGIKNVYWKKEAKKWVVRLQINGKETFFGGYKDIDYARFIAEAMRHKYHKEFANDK